MSAARLIFLAFGLMIPPYDKTQNTTFARGFSWPVYLWPSRRISYHSLGDLGAYGSAFAHRKAYRNMLVEPLLLLAILAQIYTGAGFVRRRWRMRHVWLKVQLYSGGYLVFFLLNHSFAALQTRYGLGLDTNFLWAAATVNISPYKWFFAPNYALAVIAIFAQIGAGLQQKG